MPAIVFFRKFDEKTVPYTGNASLESLEEFVDPLMIPSYFEFSENEVENVFDKKKNILLMFRDE